MEGYDVMAFKPIRPVTNHTTILDMLVPKLGPPGVPLGSFRCLALYPVLDRCEPIHS